MSNLYLDFANALHEQPSWLQVSDNYFSNVSLQEQFDLIKVKYRLDDIETLKELIDIYFPTNENKTYYISFPGFDRNAEERGNFRTYKNLVIRARNTTAKPQEYDLVLFCDVSFKINGTNKIDYVQVKGFEFIDSNISKCGERRLVAEAMVSFEKHGNYVHFPQHYFDNALTQDVLKKVYDSYYPVPAENYDEATGKYQEWKEYVDFRLKILDIQTRMKWDISGINYHNTYKIDKHSYKKEWDELRVNKRKLTDPVILYQKVEESEKSPTVQISIDSTHSIVEELKKKTSPNKFPMKLSFFSDDNKYDCDEQIFLGDRYYITENVIVPECTDIEKKYEKLVDEKQKEIIRQYDLKIDKEAEEQSVGERDIIKSELLKKYHIEEQEESLDFYLEAINHCSEVIKKEANVQITQINQQIEKIKKSYMIRTKRYTGTKNSTEALEECKRNEERSISNMQNILQEKLVRIFKRHGVDPFEAKIIEELNKELEKIKISVKEKLEVVYDKDRLSSINAAKEKLDFEKKCAIEKRKDEKTFYRVDIFFMAESYTGIVQEKEIDHCIKNYRKWILTYNDIRERAKLERQKKALNDFYCGILRNPYLPLQLLSPESIEVQDANDIHEDIKWFNPQLNQKQRSAISRALKSDGVFLLQGPPGTGKTDVIAELTAQLAKAGKKVAVSSETHKAIENVFDRLVKVPEIRAIRLMKSENRSDYRPDMIVDNFYDSIVRRLKKNKKRLQNPEELLNNFKSELEKLALAKVSYDKLKSSVSEIEKKKSSLEDKCKRITIDIAEHEETQKNYDERVSVHNKAIQYINSCDFNGDTACTNLLLDFESSMRELLFSEVLFGQVDISDVQYLYQCDMVDIQNDLTRIRYNADYEEYKRKLGELKKKKTEITDVLTEDALPGHEDDWEVLRTKIKQCALQMRSIEDKKQDLSAIKLVQVIGEDALLRSNQISGFVDELLLFRNRIKSVMKSSCSKIEQYISNFRSNSAELSEKIELLKTEYSDNQIEIKTLINSDIYSDFSNADTRLKNIIADIVREFVYSKEYDSIDDGLELIKNEYYKVEKEQSKMQHDSETLLPMYDKICNYLEDKEILEEDKERYTQMLIERTNVYGFTCSSGKSNYNDVDEWIDNFNLQNAGIDVVIIDEVSKSSFIDLLVPILYGKSVVLVGDHRQLPPMYDLRHMDENDFKDMGYLDAESAHQENIRFTNMYENSYFKNLFERVPEIRRESLRKQYRCHSHIMDVFNHFYGGSAGPDTGLTIGSPNQDIEKGHNLLVKIENKTVITPEKHIYFVDCNGEESGEDESTSIKNEQEAKVVTKLLEELNVACKNSVDSGVIEEGLSVGVICTYRLQSKLIKRMCNSKRLNSFSSLKEERLMFDTVDNFQGDERDIIIVSMVRSPQAGKSFSPEFIKQFERINVALSRARRLLIVVGNKEFLSTKCKIHLPDMYGNAYKDKRNYPIYDDIIKTISQKGIVLNANDILGGSHEIY